MLKHQDVSSYSGHEVPANDQIYNNFEKGKCILWGCIVLKRKFKFLYSPGYLYHDHVRYFNQHNIYGHACIYRQNSCY